MIANSAHFEAGYEYAVRTMDLGPTYALWLVGSGDLTLYFPTREIRDAVRDALLQCPGCVARPEVEAQKEEPAIIIPEPVGFVAESGEPIRAPQPAVQAMDATEDWF